MCGHHLYHSPTIFQSKVPIEEKHGKPGACVRSHRRYRLAAREIVGSRSARGGDARDLERCAVSRGHGNGDIARVV
ncbi:hypothetical protein A0H81_07356 [Grifola frondosa]|uniref:Uncharacterized protein n=1 Tax=Grifola frondosa TaxID=5627 RepID=A0A1C7M710_GRIFR|nr:hypothetical protein A0H81_07356 [Grifola frondosa]